MKYENIAEQLHLFDFVFYETDAKAKKMYIYCPNCGQTYEHEITKTHSIAWIKENFRPCECFEYRGKQPDYKQTRYPYENLSPVISVAEFENCNGEAVCSVYWNTASFGASNYDVGNSYDDEASPYALYRNPCYSTEKVIEITFKSDGSVTYYTSIYVPMCSSKLKSGEWRKAARWRATSFVFDVIEQSLCELKGTNLEQYATDIEEFNDILSYATNTEANLNETCIAFLALLHTSPSTKKLWKAGYKRLVFNRVIETMAPHDYSPSYSNVYLPSYDRTSGVINWRGKTLEKILKIAPQKLDLISERKDVTVEELRGTQAVAKLEKLGIAVSTQNVQIALSGKMKSGEMTQIYTETGFPISKMFKYIRHQTNRYSGTEHIKIDNATNDYCDYLEMLKKLKTPFTKDVVFPTDLKRVHDAATATLKKLRTEQNDGAFKSAVEQFSAIAYASDDFFIEPIKSAIQLSKEANKMHNCSAGYIDRIIKGYCALFIIRQKKHPRTPFCMLELNLKSFEIVQNRAVHNAAAPEAARAFATIWLNNIVKPYKEKLKKSKAA